MLIDSHDALGDLPRYVWVPQRPAAENYHKLGTLLAASTDIFLLVHERALAVLVPGGDHRPVETATDLDAVIKDRLDARMPDGKDLPKRDLGAMLKSRTFLECFRRVGMVTQTPLYLPNWRLTDPGYNEGLGGEPVFYNGPPAEVADTTETIRAFLDVMAFKGNPDRTNAVGLALTIRLRNFWPGAKPLGAILGNKSHCGKDTVRDFAVGVVETREISWELADWAVEQTFEKVTRSPGVGVVSIGNVRAGRAAISSAFVERFVTDPQPFITSTKTREARHCPNRIVVVVTANQGGLSSDLMNRALPICLEAMGDVCDRRPAIGNPREEFLPANRARIEAELHGMIARWREAGCPLDTDVRHPMKEWAQTVGGILKANGFEDFLGDYGTVVTVHDDVREALAILGAATPGRWLTATEWVGEMHRQGLSLRLIRSVDRENAASKARRLGQILTAHDAESFRLETDSGALALRLGKRRFRREQGGEARVCYKFEVLEGTGAPEDQPSPVVEAIDVPQAPAEEMASASQQQTNTNHA